MNFGKKVVELEKSHDPHEEARRSAVRSAIRSLIAAAYVNAPGAKRVGRIVYEGVDLSVLRPHAVATPLLVDHARILDGAGVTFYGKSADASIDLGEVIPGEVKASLRVNSKGFFVTRTNIRHSSYR